MQKLAVKARRIGFSEVVAFERACRAVGIDLIKGKQRRPVNQIFVSAGLSQSKDLLARCMKHVRALGIATPVAAIERDGTVMCQLVNGAKLQAFSSNPNTIRGTEGDLTLDEFGAMPRKEKVWAAAAPLAKPNLGNPEGFQICVIGTPEGDSNLFYEMAKGKRRHSFSQHKVTVQEAVKDGFPLRVQNAEGDMVPGTIDDLREEIGDPEIFEQEFECEFHAANMRYISSELYDSAVWHGELPQDPSMRYGGMDVARKNDASAISILELLGSTLWQHEKTDARLRATWDDQEAWVDSKLTGVSRFAVDATSIGSQFAERMVSRWGSVIIPITFTNQVVEALATGMKLTFERHRLRLRPDDQDLRRDVLSLRRIITDANNIRFSAPATKHGHADRAYAFMLAVHASGAAKEAHKPPVLVTPTMVRDRSELPAHLQDGFARPKRGAWR